MTVLRGGASGHGGARLEMRDVCGNSPDKTDKNDELHVLGEVEDQNGKNGAGDLSKQNQPAVHMRIVF